MKLPALALTALLLLAGCVTTPRVEEPSPASEDSDDGLSRTRLGETVAVGGPKVTPVALLEDSRCPTDTRCIWAGRVRVTVRVDLGRGSQMRELTQGQPVPVADGTLELVAVQPDRTEHPIAPEAYRFGFRFMGGL